MIKDLEMKSMVRELVHDAVQYLVDPELETTRMALLESLAKLDERGEELGQCFGWLVAHKMKQELE